MPSFRRNLSLWGLAAASIVLAGVTAGFLWLQYKPVPVKDVTQEVSPFDRKAQPLPESVEPLEPLKNVPQATTRDLSRQLSDISQKHVVAERLASLDLEPGGWDQRLERYQAEKAMLRGAGLSESELDQALVRLRQRLFNPDEVRRVEALDRLAEG